ncbi:YraN family protein [Pseudidiomarina sp. CB1]|uniref:YraN family protein n=1 Tax=Pseudidiomarina sp. CB1 TaxID=2972484 RepID=UPI00216234E3|nr:YraN family protein [Pseudidiomarina sp. CB1]
MLPKATGNAGEAQAVAFLHDQQLRLVERNYRCDLGEIDIIMRDHEHWVFIEVKYRKNEDFATVVEQITQAQCQRIRRSAQFYLLSHKLDEHQTPMRFDVVAICEQPEQLYWLPDAF